MVTRWVLGVLVLCWANISLAEGESTYRIMVTRYGYPGAELVFYREGVLSDYGSAFKKAFAKTYLCSKGYCTNPGNFPTYKNHYIGYENPDFTGRQYTILVDVTEVTDCIPTEDGSDCVPADEGCEDMDTPYSVTGSLASACITLPSGSSCQSSCKSGICVDVGDGIHDHTLTGRSCDPSDTTDDVCNHDATGSIQCYSSPYKPNPTNPYPPANGGLTDPTRPLDLGSGSGGGAFETGGGSTSGGAVDSPVDASGQSRDYTAALNRIIANQDGLNRSALSIINNQGHQYNALVAIRAATEGTRTQTAEQKALLAQILAVIESQAGAGAGGDGDGSGGSGFDDSGIIAAINDGAESTASRLDGIFNSLDNSEIPEFARTEIPVDEIDMSNFFTENIDTDIFSASASCPADVDITVMGKPFAITYQPFCDFAAYVRPAIVFIAWMVCIYILVRRGGWQ
ncbi:virulence factor TspB C-terminal domain-related protein [Zobellella sp. An-6]|uniref:virulence factor TspB C-terminal domain-related protein n=1 Tax=Zobellella sp. An-6 TaxID=3400218 RepID=UPI00404194A3